MTSRYLRLVTKRTKLETELLRTVNEQFRLQLANRTIPISTSDALRYQWLLVRERRLARLQQAITDMIGAEEAVEISRIEFHTFIRS